MGSEMCIRDRYEGAFASAAAALHLDGAHWGVEALYMRVLEYEACLLYTSDAADERSSVDLGGRRIIKTKKSLQT